MTPAEEHFNSDRGLEIPLCSWYITGRVIDMDSSLGLVVIGRTTYYEIRIQCGDEGIEWYELGECEVHC